MCFGRSIHQAASPDLNLGAWSVPSSTTCCEFERESCFGWKDEFDLGNSLFSHDEINHSCFLCASPRARAVKRNRDHDPWLQGTGIYSKRMSLA